MNLLFFSATVLSLAHILSVNAESTKSNYGGCAGCGMSVDSARDYVSGELISAETFTYGRFETRMRIAKTQGTVSTFFLYKEGSEKGGCNEVQQLCRPLHLPDGSVITERKQCWQELDAEGFGSDGGRRLQSTVIVGQAENRVVSNFRIDLASELQTNIADAFATVTLEWTPKAIRWLVDGRVVREIDDCIYTEALTGPLRIHLSLWPCTDDAKDWCGVFDPSAVPSLAMYEYVKVWDYDAVTNTFKFKWQDDFSITINKNRWWSSTSTFPENRAQFDPLQTRALNGYAIIFLNEKSKTGVIDWSFVDYTPPGSMQADAIGPTDPKTLGSVVVPVNGNGNTDTGNGGTDTTPVPVEEPMDRYRVLVANLRDVNCTETEQDGKMTDTYTEVADVLAESLGLARGSVYILTHVCETEAAGKDSTTFFFHPKTDTFAQRYDSDFLRLLLVWEAVITDTNSILRTRFPRFSVDFCCSWALWSAESFDYWVQPKTTGVGTESPKENTDTNSHINQGSDKNTTQQQGGETVVETTTTTTSGGPDTTFIIGLSVGIGSALILAGIGTYMYVVRRARQEKQRQIAARRAKRQQTAAGNASAAARERVVAVQPAVVLPSGNAPPHTHTPADGGDTMRNLREHTHTQHPMPDDFSPINVGALTHDLPSLAHTHRPTPQQSTPVQPTPDEPPTDTPPEEEAVTPLTHTHMSPSAVRKRSVSPSNRRNASPDRRSGDTGNVHARAQAPSPPRTSSSLTPPVGDIMTLETHSKNRKSRDVLNDSAHARAPSPTAHTQTHTHTTQPPPEAVPEGGEGGQVHTSEDHARSRARVRDSITSELQRSLHEAIDRMIDK